MMMGYSSAAARMQQVDAKNSCPSAYTKHAFHVVYRKFHMGTV